MIRSLQCRFGWFLSALAMSLAMSSLAGCSSEKEGEDVSMPTIESHPASVTAAAGSAASFTVAAGGSAPLAYQWRRNGADLAGASAPTLTLASVSAADNGAQFAVVVSNPAGSVTSNPATLTVAPQVAPTITAQPAAASVAAPASALFSVSATGSAPLAYQWRRNGQDIAGATQASYSTPATSVADSGAAYSVLVSNDAGHVASADAVLTVTAAPLAPQIVTQPANATVNAGQSASFAVLASGSAPLAYQWRRNGVPIAGAAGAAYSTPPTQDGDNGALFSVVVSNAAPPAATSAQAILTVTPALIAPSIIVQPASVSVAPGSSAIFSVGAAGSAPLAYQWRRNGIAIPGATAASYTTPSAAAADDGARFSVVVSNAHPLAAASAEATLTVLPAWSGVREDGAPGLSFDAALAVATDPRGNTVIAGTADGGDFASDPAGLRSDAFVAKYSAAGVLLWAHRFPVPGNIGAPDEATGVATDSSGNVYVVGHTQGTFAGQLHAGGVLDVAVLKYDPAGNLLWARQFGSASEDFGRSIAVDGAGNVFVVGDSQGRLPLQAAASGEIFIARFDTDGNRLWIRQWGSGGDGANRDAGRGVAVDAAGNAYMTGYIPFAYAGTTPGGSGDGFAAKYASNGDQLWFTRIRGLSNDVANAVAVAADGNAIYLTGRTNSLFDQPGYPPNPIFCCGDPDAFIARLGGAGAIEWIHNLSSVPQALQANFSDVGTAVATDASGSAVFITGHTMGAMPGETSRAARDIFVARYDGGGTLGWVRQFGADIPALGTRNDAGFGIARDRNGDLFVVGEVFGTFGTPNPNTDRTDWFVMKLRPADGSAY